MTRGLLRLIPAAFLGVKLATLAVNLWAFPRLTRPPGPHPARARVSVLVPARDEAHNLRDTLPGLLAQGAGEVVVLDDGSRDGTADVARTLGARVQPGTPLPAGWTGKAWACWQLAGAASGEWLLFTDADVTWHPGALDALLHAWDRDRPGLLSVFPRQANVGVGERLLTPLVDDVLLSFLPAPVLRIPHRTASAANGQVMLFRREAYAASGGHAGVRALLLEDVALARAVKASGQGAMLALGRDLISVRMYRSFPESVRGFGKNALPMHGGSRAALLGSWALNLGAYTLPLLRRDRPLIALGLLGGLLVRCITGRTRPADLAEVALLPAVPLLSLPVFARAWRRTVAWKGRRYAQGAP